MVYLKYLYGMGGDYERSGNVSGYIRGLDAVINISVYTVIVLLFIAGMIRCIAPISRTRATIRRAIRSIKQGATGKRSWQEDKFLAKAAFTRTGANT